MNWKGIVKSIAPMLGTALGGPIGGVAAKMIAGKFLSNENATEEELEDFITHASPDQLLKLKELEVEFKKFTKQAGIDVFKLEVQDKASARELFKVNIWPQITLSAIYVLGYFVVLYAMLTGQVSIQADMRDTAENLIAMLGAPVLMILQFWFGSSMGSKEKTNKLG